MSKTLKAPISAGDFLTLSDGYQTDAAANIIAARPPLAPDSWEQKIKNDTSFPMRLAAGAGVVLVRSTFIPAHSVARFLAHKQGDEVWLERLS